MLHTFDARWFSQRNSSLFNFAYFLKLNIAEFNIKVAYLKLHIAKFNIKVAYFNVTYCEVSY